MVKIEKLLDGAKVTIERNGVEAAVLEGQLFPEYELNTLKVHSGKVIYSVDETDVVEVAAAVPKIVEVQPKAAPKPVANPVAKPVAKSAKAE
jgi:hypothetical protein